MIRHSIQNAISHFEELSRKQKNALEVGLRKATLNAQRNLMIASPVGEGTFRSSWDHEVIRTATGIKASVYNTAIHAEPLEIGSIKGRRPWPNATGIKTVEHHGRIWSTQAVGGVLGPTLTEDFINEMVNGITRSVFGDE